MDTELLKRVSEIEAIRGDARELLEALSEDQFHWRADAEHWSIAECVAHLLVAGGLYIPRIERSIERGRARAQLATGPHRHPLLGRLFVWIMEPPVRMRFKAPKPFAPTTLGAPYDALEEFLSLQDQLKERMTQADGLDLGSIRVSSPISRSIKMSLGQSFALVLSHERRHLWQTRQIRGGAAFPQP
jgi:uncharacterized damage-inducible protein DinB